MVELAAVFATAAGLLGAADTVPYVRDTLRRSTVPHRGTWLIWSVLAVIAVGAQRADGARWSLLPLTAQAIGTCLIFALSVRFGTGGLSKVDLGLIAIAGTGVVAWLAVDEPAFATACVICADLVAALLMVPKTWREPHSETLSTFVLAAVGGALAACSVGSASVHLLAYPAYFSTVNAALAGVIIARRRRLAGNRLDAPGDGASRARDPDPQECIELSAQIIGT